MKMESTNSRVLHVFIVIGLLFACLAGSLTWFELKGKAAVMNSAYNRRLLAEEEQIFRGSILDRKGVILASTQEDEGIRTRSYPFKNLYTHVIGYDSVTYGKTLLEARYNDTLLGKDSLAIIGKVGSLISGEKRLGNNLTLTLDNALQKKARELMGKNRGAVVALNPKTGEILAMVSTPDFDPNGGKLEDKWPALVEDENSPLLPRAVMGLYPPGSTFKVVTAAAAIEKGLTDTQIEDAGSIVIDGKTFSNHSGKAYGSLDMTGAFTVSSNVYFSQLAEKVGGKALTDKAEKGGFANPFTFDLPLTASRMGTADMGRTELAATGIGQGKLLATPLQMAMISAGIANDGVIMKPYVVGSTSDAKGTVLKTTRPQSLYQFTDAAVADAITEMMIEVVKKGTGTKARISGTTVAGKTGTAQNEKSVQGEGFDHAWFIGFAPADDPQIAVAVILEYQGKGGGQAAAPNAGKVVDAWLKTAGK